MTNLFKMESGKLNAFISKLAEAGMTAELAEELRLDPIRMKRVVKVLEPKIGFEDIMSCIDQLSRWRGTLGSCWRNNKPTNRFSFSFSQEFEILVDYKPVPYAELLKRFGPINSSWEKQVIEDHPSCKDEPRTPGCKTFVLRLFDKKMDDEEVIQAGQNEGCYAARYEELLAFDAAFPDLSKTFQKGIVAPGSSGVCNDYSDPTTMWPAILGARRLSGVLRNCWSYSMPVLFVRK